MFVGRKAQLLEIMSWVEDSTAVGGFNAAIVKGRTGIGKSALLKELEGQINNSADKGRYAHYIRLNANETSSSFCERLLSEIHQTLRPRFLSRGPDDSKILKAFLEAIPPVGRALAGYIREDKRASWQKVTAYFDVISRALPENGRFLILIDPDLYMNPSNADEWFSIARDVPNKIRILFAQRPEDVLASNTFASQRFAFLPQSLDLPELTASEVEDWYRKEIDRGRLVTSRLRWNTETINSLCKVSFDKYRGLAVAHESVIRLLSSTDTSDPVRVIYQTPKDITALLNSNYDRVRAKSSDQLALVHVLATLGMPCPLDILSGTIGKSEEQVANLLIQPELKAIVASTEPGSFELFHPLLIDVASTYISVSNRKAIQKSCWEAVKEEFSPEQLAKGNPSTRVISLTLSLIDNLDKDEKVSAVNSLMQPLMRQNQLVEIESILQTIIKSFDRDPALIASALNNLAMVYRRANLLDKSEELSIEVIQILLATEPSIQRAAAYLNLAIIHIARDQIPYAQEMLVEAQKDADQTDDNELKLSISTSKAIALTKEGAYAEALALFDEVSKSWLTEGNLDAYAVVMTNAGSVLSSVGQHDKALRYYEEAIQTLRELENDYYLARALKNLGLCYIKLNNFLTALSAYEEAAEVFLRLNMLAEQASALESAALCSCGLRKLEGAAILLSRSAKILLSIGDEAALKDLLLTAKRLGFSLASANSGSD